MNGPTLTPATVQATTSRKCCRSACRADNPRAEGAVVTSSGIPVFTGHDKCPWCDRTPPAGEPKTSVHVGSTVQENACLHCALDRDNLVQPRRTT